MKDSLAAHLDLVAGFRPSGAKERATFLRRIGEQIETLGDELIQVCHEESRLTVDRLRGERVRKDRGSMRVLILPNLNVNQFQNQIFVGC
jgi:acyl-CoA reductase-like NAD-dependent aldehyde dehydrogenase